MSVVIIDTEERTMYSDTNVTLASTDAWQVSKSMQLHIGDYKVLLGGIGVPSIVDMLMAFAISDIEAVPSDVSIREYPTFSSFIGRMDVFNDRVSALSHVSQHDTFDSEVIVAVEDCRNGDFHVGHIISHNPVTTWGVRPAVGDTTICLASNQATSAWRSTRGPILQRITQLCNVIQFLKFPNSIDKLSIDGEKHSFGVSIDDKIIRTDR